MRFVVAVVLVAAVARGGEPGAGLAKEMALAKHPPKMARGAKGVNAPEGEIEKKVMHDLACMCGSCRRQALDECECDEAAAMRGEVKRLLAGREVATAAGRQRAYEAVRAAFAAKYGARVLQPSRENPAGEGLSWLPLAIFAGGAGSLLVFSVRSRRRRARRRA